MLPMSVTIAIEKAAVRFECPAETAELVVSATAAASASATPSVVV